MVVARPGLVIFTPLNSENFNPLCTTPSESGQSLKKEFIAFPQKKIEQPPIALHPRALQHLPNSQTEEIDGTESNEGPLSHTQKK